MAKQHISIPILTEKDIQRFQAKVQTGEPNNCWLWLGKIGQSNRHKTKNIFTRRGYGEFSIKTKGYPAHRIAYYIANGESPAEMFICHTCDNRACVNPAHLVLGTHKDNMQDMVQKNRQSQGDKHAASIKIIFRGEQNHMCKLTAETVLEIRRLFEAEHISKRALARKFNCGQRTVQDIINRRTWKHI